MGSIDIGRSVEGRGMGWGTWGIQDGHYRDFQEGKAGNLKEVGLGWINGGRKDRGFGSEVVVNSCFEDLEGRMGLNKEWEFIPKVGKKE